MAVCIMEIAAALPAAAEPARVVAMSDGDSGRFDLAGRVVAARVMDLDSPETGSHARCAIERERGAAAKAFAFTVLPPGRVVDLWLSGRLDKYGRALVRVTVDGRDYATAMIAAGHGVRYDGRKKPDWCGGSK
jgi:micrococcal nuclease